MATRPLVLAHRGASAYAPENTFAAFDLAVELGAPALETDVRATADGHLVLLHDERVDRTTDGHGPVADLTLAEVKALDAGSWFEPRFAGQRVPTLGEFLARYARRVGTQLEVKAQSVEAQVVATVGATGLLADPGFSFTSFSLEIVGKLHQLAPGTKVGYLARAFDRETIARTVATGAEQIAPRAADLTPEMIAAARDVGLEVRAWGVSDDALLAKVIALGVDGFTTNWPDRGLGMLSC
jgi:glycerophosphoryl diester phosphodiesterase